MNREQLLNAEIFIPAELAGAPRILSNEFWIPFKGSNSLTSDNQLMRVLVYEKVDQPVHDDIMSDFERAVRSQFKPLNFPDLFPLPKFYHNLDAKNDGVITESVFIWEQITNSDLDLRPFFKFNKMIFVFKRVEATFDDMNELHLVVDPL